MKTKIFCCLISLPLLALAQQPVLQGPGAGFLIDESAQTVRPIVGVPGASFAGDATVTGSDLVAPSPDGRKALIYKDKTISIATGLLSSNPALVPLTFDRIQLNAAGWSAGGEAVAVYDAVQRQIFLFAYPTANNAYSYAQSIDASALTSTPRSMVVDAHASFVLATVQNGPGMDLVLLNTTDAPRVLAAFGQIGTMVLDGTNLYLTDRTNAEVDLVTGWTVTTKVTPLASAPANGLGEPSGLALSADRKTLFVADAKSAQVLAIDAATGATNGALALDFSPTRMDAMGSGLYLIDRGDPGNLPAHLLQLATMTVYAVPVSASPSGTK